MIANSPLNRRRFIQLSASAAGLAALPLSFSLQANDHKTAVPALQLYTLRDWMAVSVPGTLQLVAGVGYKELEFAGYYDHSPKEIKRLLDGEGLSAPSSHVPLDMFKAGVNKVIDTALEIGHRYVVVPYLTEEQRGNSIDVYKRLAADMNSWGEACNKAGLKLAYHNHDFEFFKTDGQIPYDVLLSETDADKVAMEMDLYWMFKAKQDPLAYFNKHTGRFKLWHVKDMDKAGAFADVGTGTIDFAPIFAAADKAGVEHYVVERDQTQDKLATIQQGYKAVNKLLHG